MLLMLKTNTEQEARKYIWVWKCRETGLEEIGRLISGGLCRKESGGHSSVLHTKLVFLKGCPADLRAQRVRGHFQANSRAFSWGRRRQGPPGCISWLQHLLKGGRTGHQHSVPAPWGGLQPGVWDGAAGTHHVVCELPASHSWHLSAVEGTLPVPTAGPGPAALPAGCSWCLGVHGPGMSLRHFLNGCTGGLPSTRGARDPEGPLQEGSAAHEVPLSATFHVPPKAARIQGGHPCPESPTQRKGSWLKNSFAWSDWFKSMKIDSWNMCKSQFLMYLNQV